MPLYESVFIARQDIATPQVDTLTDTIQKIIEDQGGSIAKREYWGLRSIAHKIKKNRKGHYTLLNIDAPAPAIHEMERQMRINEDVLRYLTIRMDELEEGPSVMMRSRPSDDRPRRGPRDDDDSPSGARTEGPVPAPVPLAVADAPVADAPAVEAVADAPVVDEPVVEAPVVEADTSADEKKGDEE